MWRSLPTGAAASVDRFFELCLLGLVASGYWAVLGSAYLDTPTAVVVGAALVLRALLVAGVVRLPVPERLVGALALAYIGFFPIDYFVVSRDFLAASVHLVFFLATQHSPQLAGRHHGPHVPLRVLPQALPAAGLAGAGPEPGPTFRQRPPAPQAQPHW